MKLWQRNLLLLVLVVVLAALPLVFVQGAAWKGADDRGMQAIQEVDASYQPWFGHVFDPSALGIERYMFGTQALLGAAFTFGVIGWFAGRRRALAGNERTGDLRMAGVIAAVGALVAVALFFPHPQSGELQDLITALQGVCIGFFAFFAGYPLGQRSGRRAAAAASGATGAQASTGGPTNAGVRPAV